MHKNAANCSETAEKWEKNAECICILGFWGCGCTSLWPSLPSLFVIMGELRSKIDIYVMRGREKYIPDAVSPWLHRRLQQDWTALTSFILRRPDWPAKEKRTMNDKRREEVHLRKLASRRKEAELDSKMRQNAEKMRKKWRNANFSQKKENMR